MNQPFICFAFTLPTFGLPTNCIEKVNKWVRINIHPCNHISSIFRATLSNNLIYLERDEENVFSCLQDILESKFVQLVVNIFQFLYCVLSHLQIIEIFDIMCQEYQQIMHTLMAYRLCEVLKPSLDISCSSLLEMEKHSCTENVSPPCYQLVRLLPQPPHPSLFPASLLVWEWCKRIPLPAELPSAKPPAF